MAGAVPKIIVEAPPGAGKTMIVAFALAQITANGETGILVEQNYDQLIGAVLRTQKLFPWVPLTIFASAGRVTAIRAAVGNGVAIVTKKAEAAAALVNRRLLCTVTARLTMFRLTMGAGEEAPEVRCSWLVIDEAWQMRYADFKQMASLAPRALLVGDRGQIEPIVTVDTSRWSHLRAGVHLAAPEALLNEDLPAGSVRRVPLLRSYRLSQKTALMLGPIFYSRLAFNGTADVERQIDLPDWLQTQGADALRRSGEIGGPGAVAVMLPARPPRAAADVELLDAIVRVAGEILESGATIVVDGVSREIRGTDVVVLTTRNADRAYLSRALGNLPGVLVRTANSFQGSERPIVLAVHPLARDGHSAFDFDAGRLCVLLSRHTHACLLFYRADLASQIAGQPPAGEIALAGSIDQTYAGWAAHRAVLAYLANGAEESEFPES